MYISFDVLTMIATVIIISVYKRQTHAHCMLHLMSFPTLVGILQALVTSYVYHIHCAINDSHSRRCRDVLFLHPVFLNVSTFSQYYAYMLRYYFMHFFFVIHGKCVFSSLINYSLFMHLGTGVCMCLCL